MLDVMTLLIIAIVVVVGVAFVLWLAANAKTSTGENVTVAQLKAELATAKYNREQTAVSPRRSLSPGCDTSPSVTIEVLYPCQMSRKGIACDLIFRATSRFHERC